MASELPEKISAADFKKLVAEFNDVCIEPDSDVRNLAEFMPKRRGPPLTPGERAAWALIIREAIDARRRGEVGQSQAEIDRKSALVRQSPEYAELMALTLGDGSVVVRYHLADQLAGRSRANPAFEKALAVAMLDALEALRERARELARAKAEAGRAKIARIGKPLGRRKK